MSDQPDCRTHLLQPYPYDTPRTNEACRADPHGQETRFVSAGFSRQLERELEAAKERIEIVKHYADWMARIISGYDRMPASEKVQAVDDWKRFKDGQS